MIVKVPGGHVVKSESGKTLSRVYKTRKAAIRRLAEIEFFKAHKPKGK